MWVASEIIELATAFHIKNCVPGDDSFFITVVKANAVRSMFRRFYYHPMRKTRYFLFFIQYAFGMIIESEKLCP
jgi:hypothetical protein